MPQANRTDLVKSKDVVLSRFVAFEIAVRLPLANGVVDFDVGKASAANEMTTTRECRRGSQSASVDSGDFTNHHGV